MIRNTLAASALAMLCASCVGLNKPAPPLRYAIAPKPQIASVENSGRSLAIRPIEPARPYKQNIVYRKGDELGECYACADLFVFPSRTDTFGLVVIEALASGLPVAAFPATGPIDILTRKELGTCHEDLKVAIDEALKHGDREACSAEGASYTWARCTEQFLGNLVRVRVDAPVR